MSAPDRWLIVVDYEEGRPEVVLDVESEGFAQPDAEAATKRTAKALGASTRLLACKVVHVAEAPEGEPC